jgi:hypothetical protein
MIFPSTKFKSHPISGAITQRRWIPRLGLFFLLFSSIVSYGQVDLLNARDAENLQKKNYDLNLIISTCSTKGNYEKGKEYLKQTSPKDISYRIGKGLYTAYTEGPRASYKLIDKLYGNKKSESREQLFVKAFVSLMTDNKDDYRYFSSQLDSTSIYQLRLDIKQVAEKMFARLDDKKALVKKINRFLAQKNLSTSDIVYLELSKIDLENYIYISDDDYDKYAPVLKLWEAYSKELDPKKVLKYLEDCKTSACEKAKTQIKNQSKGNVKGIEKAFDLIYSWHDPKIKKEISTLEEELKAIVDASKSVEKERIKSLILSSDKEYRLFSWRSTKFFIRPTFDDPAPQLRFSEDFKKTLVTSLTKEAMVQELTKIASEIPIKEGAEELEKLTKEETQIVFGGRFLAESVAKRVQESYGGSDLFELKAKGPNRKERKLWSTYIKYLEKNPLFNEVWDGRGFVSLPEIETKGQRTNALKLITELHQKYPNNINYAYWKFWIAFQEKELFDFDAKNAELYLRTIIQIFSLNQSEGEPGGKNEEISYYVFARRQLDFAGSDGQFLAEMRKVLGEEKWTSIVNYLEAQMKIYPRNGNLHLMHLKFMRENKKAEPYLKSYIKVAQMMEKIPDLDEELLKPLDAKVGKRLLLEAYQSTKKLDAQGPLVSMYHAYGLFEEAANIQSAYIQYIPWSPNKETFFMYYYDELMTYQKDTATVQKLLETVFKNNEKVGIIALYLMMYDLVLKKPDSATTRLNTLPTLYIYHGKNLRKAFSFAEDQFVSPTAIDDFREKIKEKFPDFFDKKRW